MRVHSRSCAVASGAISARHGARPPSRATVLGIQGWISHFAKSAWHKVPPPGKRVGKPGIIDIHRLLVVFQRRPTSAILHADNERLHADGSHTLGRPITLRDNMTWQTAWHTGLPDIGPNGPRPSRAARRPG